MAKQRIKRSIDSDKNVVTFTIVKSGKELVVNPKDFTPEIIARLILHGINGKVGDSAADPKLDPMEQLVATVDQLKTGTWAQRSSGSGGGSQSTLLAEALIRVTGQDMEAVQATLEAKTDDEKKALKAHPQVKAEIDKIQAERTRDKAKKSAEAAKGAKLEF